MAAFFWAFMSIALAGPVQAQGLGALSGTLATRDGLPVPQVVLQLDGPDGAHSLVTGPAGRFDAPRLAAGEYALRVDLPGFVLLGPGRATVAAGRTTQLALRLGPGRLREQVLVSATRNDAALPTLGTSATVLDSIRLDERAARSVMGLLQDVPGVAVARTGGLGAQASAFMRGGESRFACVLVDGIPLNEPGGVADLCADLPLELAQVEVVRGAASSLYGSDALAGVIQLLTRQAGPEEGLSARGAFEAGRFATHQAQGGLMGRWRALDWNLGLLRLTTDNQEPNSAFREQAGSLAWGVRLDERTELRGFGRAADSRVGLPGQTGFLRPDLDAAHDRTSWTAGVHLRHVRSRTTHELRFAATGLDQLSLDPEDSGTAVPQWGGLTGWPMPDYTNPAGFQNDVRRWRAGYQAERRVGARHLLTAGLELEREWGALGDRRSPLLTPRRVNRGAYLQDRVIVGSRLFATVGGRLEHNQSYGTRAVPRAAVAWRVTRGPDATTVRASAGAGIKEPGFLESFGVEQYARGNPSLEPERSRTLDCGLERRFLAGRLSVGVTYFNHDYYDQIAYVTLQADPFVGSYTNLGETKAQGWEVSLQAAPRAGLSATMDYTYLMGRIVSGTSDENDQLYGKDRPLLRRPQHQGSVTLQMTGARAAGGATLVYVGRRADSDFLGLQLTRNGAYARLDGRIRIELLRNLEAFVIGENLLDRRYEEALGYPALGRALRLGLRFKTSAHRAPQPAPGAGGQ